MKELLQPLTDSVALAKVCDEIETASWLVLDTEFTRYRTYWPQLELLQIASDKIIFCVDAPCISDWSKLRKVLQSPSTTTVLHAADQDLELLHLFDLLPRIMIDSQIAAQLCGETKLSYQNLVNQCLGVSLPKDLTRSKWNRRPFSTGQIRYALDDVRFVLPLYRHYHSILQQKNRLSWLEEECGRLLELPRGDDLVDESWKLFHRGAVLSAVDQHIARKLLIWRERRARKIDWPRQWVLADGLIIELINDKPTTVCQTARRVGIKSSQIPNWVSRIHAIVNDRSVQATTPLWYSWSALRSGEQKRVGKMLHALHAAAHRHDIPGSLLCTKQEAVDFIYGKRAVRMLTGWRQAIAGPVIESFHQNHEFA